MNKPAYTIVDQISMLKQRGMLFKGEIEAYQCLDNIGYYRLKGYSTTIFCRFQENIPHGCP